MDHSDKSQPSVGGQMAFTAPRYQTVPLVSSLTQPPPIAVSNPQQQLGFPQAQKTNPLEEQIKVFWTKQMEEVVQEYDFKIHSLPLARIKKIMKADEDVRMISAEAPVIFSKGCEMFILELSLRSWIHTEENRRRTLQKNDIAAAITKTDVFDFLVDIIPRDEFRDDGLVVTNGSLVDMPYYFVPAQHHQPMGPIGMMMGNPTDQSALFAGSQQPQPPTVTFMQWPPTHVAQQALTQQQEQQPQQQQQDTEI